MALVRVIVTPESINMNENDYIAFKYTKSDYDGIHILDTFKTVLDLEEFILKKYKSDIGNHLSHIVSVEPFVSRSVSDSKSTKGVKSTLISEDGIIKSSYNRERIITEKDVIDILITSKKMDFIKRD